MRLTSACIDFSLQRHAAYLKLPSAHYGASANPTTASMQAGKCKRTQMPSCLHAAHCPHGSRCDHNYLLYSPYILYPLIYVHPRALHFTLGVVADGACACSSQKLVGLQEARSGAEGIRAPAQITRMQGMHHNKPCPPGFKVIIGRSVSATSTTNWILVTFDLLMTR